MELKIKSFLEFILDLFFPKYCAGCGKEGTFFCSECKEKVIVVKSPTCFECNKLTKRGEFCLKCRSHWHLKGVIVATYFKEGPIREVIHDFKYEGIFNLKQDLSEFMIKALKEFLPFKNPILIPVPLHKRKLIRRGFNQAELLAKEIAAHFKFELKSNILERKKDTKSQTELKGRERRANVKDAFLCKNKDEILGKKIILIDDVITTGATLNECARVLKENGAKTVWALVLAKD